MLHWSGVLQKFSVISSVFSIRDIIVKRFMSLLMIERMITNRSKLQTFDKGGIRKVRCLIRLRYIWAADLAQKTFV